MNGTSPSFADVVRQALDSRMADIHVALPARVERFVAASQLADVKPLLKDSHVEPDGRLIATPLPVIRNVPVLFPAAGSFMLTFPVERGDTCLLVFSERSLDKWMELGGEVDPDDDRRSQLSDAVAILGLHSNRSPLPGVSSANMEAGAVDGPRVSFRAGSIHLGAGAAENAGNSVAFAEAVSAALSTLKSAIADAAVGSGDGGAIFKANITTALSSWPPSLATLGSSIVKVK